MSEHSREQQETYLREELRCRSILYVICATMPLIPTFVLMVRYDQTQIGLVAPMFFVSGFFWSVACGSFGASRGQE